MHFNCKCGDIISAHQVFVRMPNRDLFSWNTLVAGYSQMGFCSVPLKAFNDANFENSGVFQFSYASALQECARKEDLRNGKVFHGLIVVSGVARRPFLINSLMDMYSKCGKIDEARFAFDHAEELDSVSWNLLLSAYVRIGWPEVALGVLVWMHRAGVKLNTYALGSILTASSTIDEPEKVLKMLHACVAKVGLDLNAYVGSAMLDMYAKNGGLEEAIRIFDCIPNPNVVVFNAMIAGFSRLGTGAACSEVGVEALHLFSEMRRRGMMPSKFTYSSVLKACILSKEFQCGRQIHVQIFKNNLVGDAFISSALINLYASSGLVEESLKCFSAAPMKDMIAWASIIAGYLQNEKFEEAMALFKEMLFLGRKPDQFTLSSLISCSGDMGLLKLGEQIQCYAVKEGLDQFTYYCNSQIVLYVKIGDLGSVVRTFRDIPTINSFSWSMMILGYALHGHPTEALMLFDKMKECRVTPDEITFLAVLTACSHGGFIDEGFRNFGSMMEEFGLIPSANHCLHIVNLFGQSRRLDNAEEFIVRSSFNNEPLLWRSLLHTCQLHGDIERCILVGEKLVELDPSAVSSFTDLYNIYVDAGKVSLAMRTRGKMREKRLHKDVGVCWIEVGSSVHSFVDGDSSYPESSAISAKLESLKLRMKEMGHAGFRYLDMDNQGKFKWKDRLIRSHVERLAVAFGLISLPKNTPVRVMSNLRPCKNCHELLKLFSEVEKREIIVRDPTRFHHFEHGLCTCGDFW
ncbi:Pentatricopeptide repeat-containing protein [Platanthera zijinensis]|uniref:Pentatricopeptide repeat-containing protein n=1 Tax=Platanthera zijinensis TaxID=2320716 RepID=A0AAP0FVT5_9ASPA